ncbi:UvrD-helicase domain-containing protein [Myroides sp. DW712]|uniref:UvrD-helicase domain-containing protein n=1 Tax=Myroides sp. DW712 TaxID=3389800 RepID=UPI00397E6E16
MVKAETASFSVYNASAGSGKTHTLVKEYLKIVLVDRSDDAYRKILAITFTNKAVAEMKNRILSCLYAFSQVDTGSKFQSMLDQLVEETGMKETEIKEKSERIMKHIIHNYASFDISTIDKFTHKVIRSFAFDLNLPMSFEVSLDSDELLKEAVDSVIAKAGTDEELTKVLIDFSIDKADNDKSWDITRELKEMGALLLNENNREEIALFDQKTLQDFVVTRDYLRKKIEEITQDTQQRGKAIWDLLIDKGVDMKSFSRGTFPNHLLAIINDTDKSTQRKYVEFEEVTILKAAKDRDTIEALLPDVLHQLATIYQLFAKRLFYQAFLKNITPLSLLNILGIEMQQIQDEKNMLSISQFNAIIHNEIQHQPAPFIYERLGERYRHFFIDEFQDTSVMQWDNLVPLIDNALAGEDFGVKGTLMLVGDPKQSIYRWRGGKAEQFIALSKEVNPFSNPDKEVVVLGKNYRSYSEVIQFNNTFFNGISSFFTQEDYKHIYEHQSYQEINSKVGGYVNLQFLDESLVDKENEIDKEQLYLQATLARIQSCKEQGFPYSDMVVLTRKRAHGIALANYLTEQEIPILSSDSLLISHATEVRLIMDVLRYIRNKEDKESKSMILYYIANKRQQEAVHDFIEEGLSFGVDSAFEAWLQTKDVVISFDQCRKKSLYEAVEIIIRAFFPAKATSSYVLYFLDIVLERTSKNQYGIGDFILYWEDNNHKFSIPTPEGKEAVQLMTIHKSKGLEFPVVIFPFAEEDYDRSNRDKLWVEFDALDVGIELPKALVDAKKEVKDYGAYAEALYAEKEQEELLDNINVLYVALTRAEEQLYIITTRDLKADGEYKNNMSRFFIHYLRQQGLYQEEQFVYEFGQPERLSKQREGGTTQTKLIESVATLFDFNAIKIAEREALMWDTQVGEAIAYGNITHKIMSFIQTATDIDMAIERALEEGLIVASDKANFTQAIQQIVNHPDLQVFFAGGEVYNERMIIGKNKNNLIPDRVVIQGEKAYLLDYKTGKPEEKYVKQLEKYEESLQEMGYEVAKKVILYMGVDDLNIIHL